MSFKRSKEDLRRHTKTLKRYISYLERNGGSNNQIKHLRRRVIKMEQPFEVSVTNQIMTKAMRCDICRTKECTNNYLLPIYTRGNPFVLWTIAGEDCLRQLHNEKVPVHVVSYGYGGWDYIGS